MLAISDAQAVTAGVVILFVTMALLAIIRVVLRREARWHRIRVGIFLERDNHEREIEEE